MQFFLCFCRLKACSLNTGDGTTVLSGRKTRGLWQLSTALVFLVVWNSSPGCSVGALLSSKGRHSRGNGRVSFHTVLWPLQVESSSVGMGTVFNTSSRPSAIFAWTSLGQKKSVGIKDGATRPATQMELCQGQDVCGAGASCSWQCQEGLL